jgi:iron only hydrogenase large subunit-like protein
MPETSRRDHSVREREQQENPRTRRVDPSALAELFDEWLHGDEAEQRETFETLRRSLDDDRPVGYKLFS